MRREVISDLVLPATGAPLELAPDAVEVEGEIIEGGLRDTSGSHWVPIRNAIPRFEDGTNYADSFGIQWDRYRKLQLDSHNGSSLTHSRFYSGTGWTASELEGKRVLEAGCGAGRFSEVILEAGARLYSFDYSSAVDAAWKNNGNHTNWNLFQADIYDIPFRLEWFDFVFCYGVLQHTPRPKLAFQNLCRYLKPGGEIAADIYEVQDKLNKLSAKYWYRPITKRVPDRILLKVFECYLPWWTPIDSRLQRVPLVGPWLSVPIPCWNKSSLPLRREHQLGWTILDTFDAFSCKYDYPQMIPGIETWCQEAGLTDVSVRRGGNGIEWRARRPLEAGP